MCTDLESGKAKAAADGSEMRFRFRSMVRLLTVAQGISTATAQLHLSYRGVLKFANGFL